MHSTLHRSRKHLHRTALSSKPTLRTIECNFTSNHSKQSNSSKRDDSYSRRVAAQAHAANLDSDQNAPQNPGILAFILRDGKTAQIACHSSSKGRHQQSRLRNTILQKIRTQLAIDPLKAAAATRTANCSSTSQHAYRSNYLSSWRQ